MHLNCMARMEICSGSAEVLLKSSGGWGLRFLPWLTFPTKPTPAERLEARSGRRVRNQCNCNCAVLLAKAEHFTVREMGENGFSLHKKGDWEQSPLTLIWSSPLSFFKRDEASKKPTPIARAVAINSQSSAPFVVRLHTITTSHKCLP